MGTSNFHNVNAHNVYAVLMNYEQPIFDEDDNETGETEYVTPDLQEIEDFVEYTTSIAKDLSIEKKVSFCKECDSDPHELRSFESTPLFQFFKQKSFGDMSIAVSINCVIRHGYYEGGNLDWYMTYDTVNHKGGEIDFADDFEYCSNMPAGMIKIQCKNAERWAEKTTDELVEITEELFKQQSMPLVVTARFSNGETHYSKAI